MWPLRFRTLLMQFYKMGLFLTYIFVFMLGSLCIIAVPSRDFWQRKKISKWASLMSKITLKTLGIRIVNTKKYLKTSAQKINNYFIVSNHLGYLDILAISAHMPSTFVTSVEIKNTPFLGLLARLGGCLYVERRNRDNIHNEVHEITGALNKGLNVCVFPEATSTNGDQVLRFRRPLYNAAINSNTDILPLCLNYTCINDEPLSSINRDKVFWYGKMSFLPHLWRLMGCESVELRIEQSETLSPSHLDCPELATRTHTAVSALFQRPVMV